MSATATSVGGSAYYLEGCESEQPMDYTEYLSRSQSVATGHGHEGAVSAHAPTYAGKGSARLGLSGVIDKDEFKMLVDELRDPKTGKQLGKKPGKYETEAERLARLLVSEPDATPERIRQLEIHAHKGTRTPCHATDLTLSVQKSISAIHAALEAEGRHEEATEIWKAIDVGVEAAMEYLTPLVMIRPSAHASQRINGRATTKYIPNDELVRVNFRHDQSRDGEPQLHVHVMILNRVYDAETDTWRAPSLEAVYDEMSAIDAVFMRTVEAEVHRRLGYVFATRPDGKAREILGIPEQVRDFFSSRRRALTVVADKLVAEYRQRYNREPSPWLLYKMYRHSTLATRKAKAKVAPARETELQRWGKALEAEIKTSFAAIVRDVRAVAASGRRSPSINHNQVIAQALAALEDRKQKWKHGDLVFELAKALPDTLSLEAGELRALLDRLVAETLNSGQVVNLKAPDFIEVPPELQRPDGSCIFEKPMTERYATLAQLQTEDGLVDGLKWRGAWTMDVSRATSSLERYPMLDAGQRAMVLGLLTDGKFIGLVSAAGGSGKTTAISVYREILKEEFGAVAFGLSTAQTAANILRDEGFEKSANVARVLDYYERLHSGKKVSQREREKYELPKGSVWVVDEASMLDTTQAARLAALARQHNWKIVFVGDPNQLDAVGPAGAFGLLCEKGTPYLLEEVHRQAEQWERDATLGIRVGDPEALIQYDRRGRFMGGDAADMKRAAYENFLADHIAGVDSLLICGSNEEAAEASSRVHEELVRLGRIDDTTTVMLRDDVRAGIGALVTTRRNKCNMREPGTNETYHLVNREVWRITDIYDNGSAYAFKVLGRDEFGNELHGERRFLPAWYMREHVDLAYASTVHAAQGRTVQNMHVVVDELMDRVAFYVAMSRGKNENRAYVVTKQIDKDTREHYLDRLASMLDREGDRLSATQFLEREQDRAEHLGNLGARWTILVNDHRHEAYSRMFAEVMSAHDFARYEQDSATANLHRLIAAMELRGLDPRQVITRIVTSRELDSADSVSQVLITRAKKLNDQLGQHLGQREFVRHTFVDRTPISDKPEIQYARAVATYMDARCLELAEGAAQNPPAHLAGLGPVPTDPIARAEWLNKAAVVEGYRQQYNVTGDDPIGRAPSWHEPEKRMTWEMSAHALHLDPNERDTKSLSDGALWNLVAAYEAELAWMPRNVDKELRTAGLAVREATTRLEIAKARSEHTANGREALEAADVLRRMQDRLAAYQIAAQARDRAYEMTAAKRELHDAAKDELRLRGLLDEQPPSGPSEPNFDTDFQIAEDLRRARAAMELLDNRQIDEDYSRRAHERDMRREHERDLGIDR